MKCPACRFEQASSDTCIHCGVIFSKYKKAQERRKESENNTVHSNPSDSSSETGHKSTKLDLDKVQVLSGGAALVLVAIKSAFVGFDGFSLLILVPFYFSFVSAVSGFWGDGLWVWWRGGFNLKGSWEGAGWSKYEGRWRVLYISIFCLSSILFAGMYLKLTKFL
jgi:hypothetical protein